MQSTLCEIKKPTNEATIIRVTSGGVAYVKDASKGFTAFSFGRIVGYKGQLAKELGLKPGKVVYVEYGENEEIVSVVVPQKLSGRLK